MSRIVWDRPKERTFETGVEKGVLYVGNQKGVPWNGLISVSDSYGDVEVEPRYQDGIKTHNYVSKTEFETEVAAYTYPEEFERCLGVYSVVDGMYIDEQTRTPFGVTYQTRIGDGVVGPGAGYKIHLIYNAIAIPNQIDRKTIGSVVEPTNFSWGLKTFPAEAPGFRPSSHFILDPSKMGPKLFSHICELLYGAPGVNPRLLYPKEIIDIADGWRVLYPSPNTYPSLESIPGGP